MINVFFIVDGPKLEAQAHVLVASIIDHMVGPCRLFAYVRPNAELTPSLSKLFDKADVSVRNIPGIDPDPWRAPYAIGNKLLAAADDRGGEISVFLDTDTVFRSTVDFSTELGGAMVGAVLSDYRSRGLPDSASWTQIYDFMKVEAPVARPGTLRRPKIDYPPYFNGGVVVFRERQGMLGSHVGQEWLKISLELDHEFDLSARGLNRANIDQIALSILESRVGAPIKQLPQRLNYNIMAWGDPGQKECNIVHYHVFGRLWRNPNVGRPVLASLLRNLGDQGFSDYVARYRPYIYWRKAKMLLE